MEFIANLFHDDMFLAVVSYLSIGLVFLLYFFYREKKWETDLEQYEIKQVDIDRRAQVRYGNGVLHFNRSSDKVVAVVGLNEEMQVVDGEQMQADDSVPQDLPLQSQRAGADAFQSGAKILPFKGRTRHTATSSISSSQ